MNLRRDDGDFERRRRADRQLRRRDRAGADHHHGLAGEFEEGREQRRHRSRCGDLQGAAGCERADVQSALGLVAASASGPRDRIRPA